MYSLLRRLRNVSDWLSRSLACGWERALSVCVCRQSVLPLSLCVGGETEPRLSLTRKRESAYVQATERVLSLSLSSV